jgi:GABA(A) receptor-associated protein
MLKYIIQHNNSINNSMNNLIKPLEKRKEETNRIMIKYPDKIPIICNRGYNKETPLLPRNKFLVPYDLTIGQFMYVIRKHMKLEAEKALYFSIGNRIPLNNSLISNIYKEHKSEDGFLYITYSIENTFG